MLRERSLADRGRVHFVFPPFHVRIDVTELFSRKTVISIGDVGHDSKAEGLTANVVELRFRSVKHQGDEIMTRKEQPAWNQSSQTMFARHFDGDGRIGHRNR